MEMGLPLFLGEDLPNRSSPGDLSGRDPLRQQAPEAFLILSAHLKCCPASNALGSDEKKAKKLFIKKKKKKAKKLFVNGRSCPSMGNGRRSVPAACRSPEASD